MALRGVCPKTVTEPAVGSERPRIMSIVVVLPAPFGPRKATISPGRMSRSIPRTAWTEPKSLRSPVAEIARSLVPPSAPGVDVVVVVVMSSRMGRPAVVDDVPSSRLAHDRCHGR